MGCLKWVFLMYGIGNKRKKSLNNLWDKGERNGFKSMGFKV